MSWNEKLYIDSYTVYDSINSISKALEIIEGSTLEIDFPYEQNNLDSIIAYIEQNNLVYIPLVCKFETNLVTALHSIGKSIGEFEKMEEALVSAVTSNTGNGEKSSLI